MKTMEELLQMKETGDIDGLMEHAVQGLKPRCAQNKEEDKNMEMGRKYELCTEPENQCQTKWGRTLSRVRALKEFEVHGHQIKAGDLGGYIWTEENLSQEGSAWVMGDVWVTRNGRVEGNALAKDNGEIGNGAILRGDAMISGEFSMWGSVVEGESLVENCTVAGSVTICGRSIVSCRCVIRDTYDEGVKIRIKNSIVPAGWFISAEFGDVELVNATLPTPPASEVYLRGKNIYFREGTDQYIDFAVLDGELMADDALYCDPFYGEVQMGESTAEKVAYKAPSVPEWCYRENCPEDLNRHERRIWEEGLKKQIAILRAVERLKAKQAVRKHLHYFDGRREG